MDRHDLLGSHSGSDLPPIGSASTLVAVNIIHKNGPAMSLGRDVQPAVPFTAWQSALATVYVLPVLQ